MKYIRLFEERLKDFEILTNSDTNFLIEELMKEIEKEDYDLDYIRDLVNYGHFDIDVIWGDEIDEGWTLLTRAASLNKADIVKVLLDADADPNLQDSDDSTALHWASRNGHSQVVQEILKCPNIDPNLQGHYDNTALHWASHKGISQVVQALLSHPKINPNLQDLDGFTALHWASNWGHSQVVEDLLSYPKIDKTITDEDGKTAWDLAKPKIREEFPELNPDAE